MESFWGCGLEGEKQKVGAGQLAEGKSALRTSNALSGVDPPLAHAGVTGTGTGRVAQGVYSCPPL